MKAYRRIPALLAIIALLFSFAGTARGAACRMAGDHATHGEQSPAHQHDAPRDTQTDTDCPLATLGAGCTTTLSLPAAATFAIALGTSDNAAMRATGRMPNLLSDAAIFHPPRT